MSNAEPSSRVARKRERVRERVLAVARDLIRERGVSGLTMVDVAEGADMSKPSLYYYFDSKEALLRALAVDDVSAEYEAVVRAIDEAAEGPAVLRDFIAAFVLHYTDDLEMFRVGYVWAQVVGMDPAEIDEHVNPSMIDLFTRLEQRLELEREAGRLRAEVHARRLAVVTWTSALGIVSTLSLCDSSGHRLFHDARDLVATLSDALIRGAFRQP